jgi:hypothetical protein
MQQRRHSTAAMPRCIHHPHDTEIAAPGDDGNYGSAATLDVLCLAALSKRIHYGKFVAEAKFRCVLCLICAVSMSVDATC